MLVISLPDWLCAVQAVLEEAVLKPSEARVLSEEKSLPTYACPILRDPLPDDSATWSEEKKGHFMVDEISSPSACIAVFLMLGETFVCSQTFPFFVFLKKKLDLGPPL